MKFYVVFALLAVASAQYDYTPPQREFNDGGNGNGNDVGRDRPAYGPPNHSPGQPVGSAEAEGDADSAATPAPPAPIPVQRQRVAAAPAQTFAQRPSVASSVQAFAQRPSTPAQATPAQGYPQRPIVSAPVQAFAPAQTFAQRPSFTSSAQGGYSSSSSSSSSFDVQESDAYTPKIYRHVYVHAAPDEPTDVQSRTIRVPGGDKHVNIIFVKTPTESSRSETEVILPPQDEQKNLVYVLLKKAENSNEVKIRRPAPAPTKKPEVYFIRYNNQQGQQDQQEQQQGYRYPRPQQSQQSFQSGNQNSAQSSDFGSPLDQAAPPGIRVPAPIRNPEDVPSSGYGVPL